MTFDVIVDGGRRVVVVQPRENSFGHQTLEVLMGLHLAVKLDADVAFRKPRRVASTALLQLRCATVAIRAFEGRLWRAWWIHRLILRLNWLKTRPTRLEQVTLQWLAKGNSNAPSPLGNLHRLAKQQLKRKGKAGRQPLDLLGVDSRERHSRHELDVRLSPSLEERAIRDAESLGVGPGTRFVTLHVRESGFKISTHVPDTPSEQLRNARIDSYFPAIDELIRRGYLVVRIGDSSMTPVRHPGVVDLATSSRRTDALEILLVMRSAFLIATDAGPFCLPLLTRTPCLGTNITDVLGAYPFRRPDRGIVKHAYDRQAGKVLSLREMLTEQYFLERKDPQRFAVIDNSPDDLRSAVIEMIAVQEAPPGDESPAQKEYRGLVCRLQSTPSAVKRRVRKGEPADQFLGEGALCDFFAARYLDTPASYAPHMSDERWPSN